MAQRSCCVPGCSMKLGGGLPLHRFPNPNNPAQIERFRTWVMKIGGDIIGEDNKFIHKNRKVCHKHFEDVYIFPNMKLTALAIPTLEIPGVHVGERRHIELPSTPIEMATASSTRPIPTDTDLSSMPEGGLHVFPNPIKFPEQFNAWVRVVSGEDECDLDYKKLRICSRHFTERDWNRNCRLNALAVPSLFLNGETTPSTQEDVCDDPVPTPSKASLASLSAPGASRATGPPIDIIQTPNSSGVDATDICDDNDDADNDSDTLVESNVCRVCLALDVKMYEFKDIELREMFQNITGIAVTENNHPILERLCWECAGRLKAAAAFRNEALLSDALLQGLASTGKQIRKNDITLIKENEDYLKSVGSMSAVEVFHVVDIDPENDSVPPVSENSDTKIVQKTVRNDSIKLKKDCIIKEDNNQMDAEAPITTEVEYDQFDHICLNTVEEISNNCLETNPVVINNVPFREDTINSANSSPPPSSSRDKPKYPIRRGYLLKPQSDFEDKIKRSIIKIRKRDSIPKIVSKKSNDVISVLKGDTKKNIYVKIGGIRKKTQVKANTPTYEGV